MDREHPILIGCNGPNDMFTNKTRVYQRDGGRSTQFQIAVESQYNTRPYCLSLIIDEVMSVAVYRGPLVACCFREILTRPDPYDNPYHSYRYLDFKSRMYVECVHLYPTQSPVLPVVEKYE